MIRIVKSTSYNPYYNLALEESLFHHCEASGEIILYLWQNNNTVVIGRNQTVFTECNLDYAMQNDVKIARRMTGGGAVYHDLGNLNFTIIVPKGLYNHSCSNKVIVNALRSLGVIAEASSRNDIFYKGLKISGNAYYSTTKAGLHHGTLLVDVDLNQMFNLLNTPRSKVSKSGISSVRSRVKNIKEICPITVEELETAVIESLVGQYGSGDEVLYGYDIKSDVAFTDLYDKYSSDKWILDQVREYSVRIEEKFSWGNAVLSCEMDGDKVLKYSISSDSLYPDIISSVEEAMNHSYNLLKNGIINHIYLGEINVIKDLYRLQSRLLGLIQEDENEIL